MTYFYKAEYIGKRIVRENGKDCVYLEFEYRGQRYEISRDKGDAPLFFKHSSAQSMIDKKIDGEEV